MCLVFILLIKNNEIKLMPTQVKHITDTGNFECIYLERFAKKEVDLHLPSLHKF